MRISGWSSDLCSSDLDHADGLEVVLDDAAQLGDQRGHVHAAGLEVAALGVERGLHLVDQEGDVAALAEHRGHDAGERDDPLEVLHGLGVDEDLERAALLVLAAEVEHDVVRSEEHTSELQSLMRNSYAVFCL